MPRLYALVIALLLTCAASAAARTAKPEAAKPDSVPEKPLNREVVERLINAKIREMQGKNDLAAMELQRAVALDSTSATLYRELAQNLLHANNLKDALTAARRAVALDPADTDLRWLVIRTLQGVGDDSATAVELEALRTLAPQDLQVYEQLSNLYRRTGQRTRLIALLDQLRRVPDLSTNARLAIVRQYYEAAALEKAEEGCREILKDDPGVGQAWHALGLILMARRDTAAAAAACRQAVAHVDIREHEPIRQMLVTLYRSGVFLDPILNEAPPDTTFLFALGRTFLASRDTSLYRKAVQVLDRAASGVQPSAEQWIDVANAHRINGDFQQAVDLLQKAASLFPRNGDLHYTMGYALIGAGKLEEAAAAFQKALAINADNPLYRYGMGLVQQRRKQWPEAVLTFQGLAEKTQRTPLYIDVLFSLGSSLERAGRFGESVEVFQKLINLAPQHAEALNYLGYMFAEKGVRLEEAEGLVKRALEIDGDNGAFLDSLGWTYYQLGRYRDAEPLLDQAIQAEIARKSDGENLAVIYDHIGDNAQKLGNAEKARDAWKKALDANPGDKKITAKYEASRKSAEKP